MQQRSYCGAPPAPDVLAESWNLDPWLLAAMAAALLLFARRATLASPRCVAAGFGVLCLAFVSPLCALTNALFAARAVHHLLLFVVAAPLLAIGLAPAARARPIAPALVASSVVLWGWHLPAAYAAALSSTAVYWLMQGTLLGSALWFWRRVLDPAAEPTGALPAIVAGMAQMGMLGAVLTFAPDPLYAGHLTTTMPYGLSAREDQQLAGLIMWVPAMIPYFLCAVALARRAWPRLLAPA